MEEKELNLCEILKGHEGMKVFMPDDGEVEIFNVGETTMVVSGNTTLTSETLRVTSTGFAYVYPSREAYLKYPLDAKKAWEEWQEEQKSKTPKTWSDITKCNVEIWQHISRMDYGPVEPIVKSVLALLKIHQLIEVGYGGNVTKDYIDELPQDKSFYMIVYNHDSEMFAIRSCTCVQCSNILFHTKKQAEEFLSYPENVQLLKDYFMI